MKQILMHIGQLFRFPLIITFGTLPIPLLLTAYYAPLRLGKLCLWTSAYILIDILGTAIQEKWRLLYGAAVLVSAGIIGWQMVITGSSLAMLLIPAVYAFLLICGLLLGTDDRNTYISHLWYQFCAAIHISAQIILYLSKTAEATLPEWTSTLLLASFFLFALLGMLSLNQSNLLRATSGRQQVSQSMKYKNQLMTLILFGSSALLSSIPFLAKLILWGFRWIAKNLLGATSILFAWEMVESFVQRGKVPFVYPEISEETSRDFLLRILVTGVTLTVVLFLTVLILYALIKGIIKLLQTIVSTFNRNLDQSCQDFHDEITDTRVGLEDQKTQRGKRNRLSATEEKRLPPDQRIRYRYKRLMQKHPEWFSGSTARENLPPEAAPIYEKVRYSPYPVTEEDAQSFAEQTKKI